MKTPISQCQAIADRLDQKAEDANAHTFVGCHEALAVLLIERVGAAWTEYILRDLAREEGLQGLVGYAGCGPDTKLVERRKLPADWSKAKWKMKK